MTIGYYQNELRDLRGNALVNAVVDVFEAGTVTPATLFADAAGSTGLTSSPLAAAAGLLLPGKDVAANYAFFADDALEYDVRVTDPGGTFTLRARMGSGGGSGAAAVGGIGALERAGAVLSGPFSALDSWRAALQSVRGGTGNARVVGIGDSTVGGYPTSLIDRMAALWGANRLALTHPGAIFPTNPSLNVDGRIAFGAGWTSNGSAGDYGLANRGMALGSVGAAGTLDIGPVVCDRFEIFFLGAAVASFDYWIDGGSHTTVSVAASAAVPSPSVVTGTVTAGSHTLHIGNIVGNPVYIFAVEPRTGTNGLYVARAGLGGTTSTMWTSQASVFASSILVFHTLQPKLTLIQLTVADLNTQPALATYRDNIDDMVVLAQTYGSCVLVVAPRPTITWPVHTYDQYIAELESIRDARGCAMVNFANHFASLPSSDYMEDTLHPTVEAQGEMALVLASALMP